MQGSWGSICFRHVPAHLLTNSASNPPYRFELCDARGAAHPQERRCAQIPVHVHLRRLRPPLYPAQEARGPLARPHRREASRLQCLPEGKPGTSNSASVTRFAFNLPPPHHTTTTTTTTTDAMLAPHSRHHRHHTYTRLSPHHRYYYTSSTVFIFPTAVFRGRHTDNCQACGCT